jgi:hypothetical protein
MVQYKRKINKYINQIAEEYKKPHPNKKKIYKLVVAGGKILKKWKNYQKHSKLHLHQNSVFI